MNRVTEYKAWGFENSEMIEVGSITFFTDGTFHINDELPSSFQGKELWRLIEFTGLKDKNGKKIFEGDILSMDSWEPKNVQVRFIEGAFCLANGKGEFVGDIHYINHADRPQSTVIGSIYQNPELCP